MTFGGRYGAGAAVYDVLSAEPVYRPGRAIGIQQLGLTDGDTVLDVGCGTGLNLSLLQEAIGPTGRIVALDASGDMLTQARRRAERHGWTNVHFLEADATKVHPTAIRELVGAPADAALATYALSVMPHWPRAWQLMLAVVRPAGRLCVVDMQRPMGPYAILSWAARLACRLGGADITAHPWLRVEADCAHVQSAAARGGHIQIRTGRRRSDSER